MDMQSILIFELITLILINVVIITGSIFFFKFIKKELTQKEVPLLPPPVESDFDLNIENQLAHSNEIMKLFQEIIKSVVVVNWHTFLDEFNFNSINKSHIEKLIEASSKEVYELIDSSKTIKFTEQNTLLTKDFYPKYIVKLVTSYTKDLFERTARGEL